MKVTLPKFIVECPDCKTYLDVRKFNYCPICGKSVSEIRANRSNSCDKCEHSSEMDGNSCYNCMKGIENNFKAKQDEVRVGNEIISDGTRAIILRINSWNDWECLSSAGVFILDSETQKYWHKTGRDCPQIREMLEQLKGEK